MNNTIFIGADHAGFTLKEYLIRWLTKHSYSVIDKGTYSVESVDYPDFAHAVASAVEENKNAVGILLCGSANGVAMTANKHQGVRAALCWKEEIAILARQHNNANIVCLPARFLTEDEAVVIVEKFLITSFDGGRHEKRIGKINC